MAEAAIAKSNNRLHSSAIGQLEYVTRVFRVVAPDSHTLDDMLDPVYWVGVASLFEKLPFPRIEVINASGTLFTEFLVLASGKGTAKVALLRQIPLDREPAGSADEFNVEFKGPQRKWSIIRKSNNAYEKEGFASKDDAKDWLDANLGNLT
jgi:hypothetical protein